MDPDAEKCRKYDSIENMLQHQENNGFWSEEEVEEEGIMQSKWALELNVSEVNNFYKSHATLESLRKASAEPTNNQQYNLQLYTHKQMLLPHTKLGC